MPPGQRSNMLSSIDMSKEEAKGHEENRSNEPIMFQGVVATNELISVHAKVVAFPTRIAERKTGQGNVAVRVGSDQIKANSHGALCITL